MLGISFTKEEYLKKHEEIQRFQNIFKKNIYVFEI